MLEQTRTFRLAAVELLAISLVALFQELTLIRWVPGQVRALAYFPNLILLSAFLGLGLGCLRARGKSLLWLWPVSLVALVLAAVGMGQVVFTHESTDEHLWLLYYDLPPGAPVVRNLHLPIISLFTLSAVSFIPLGQLLAQRLQSFRERGQSLWGYCLDILGSLTGVITFTWLSISGLLPVWWFAALLLLGLLLVFRHGRVTVGYAVAGALTLTAVQLSERNERYSPYYAITRKAGLEPWQGFDVLANGSLHQCARSLRRDTPGLDEKHRVVREGYHHPYRLLAKPPRRVLVLGAGTGNDVAVALDEGAEQVDAVEIDPVILELGKQHHPDRPYDSPKVRIINTDARSFLNESTETYDLVVFGTLDSLTRLSALSNVRLDNFVYTQESIEAARRHLAPGGGMVLYFMVLATYIDEHILGMLVRAFGEPPGVVRADRHLFNNIYLAGEAFSAVRPPASSDEVKALMELDVPTDDWPYLYLRGRELGSFYLSIMAILGLLAVAAVMLVSRQMREGMLKLRGWDMPMFLFGLAFLLLETNSVTRMGLVWGATWLTSAVVFGAILAMILLATVVTQLRTLPPLLVVPGLVVTLVVGYALPTEMLLQMDGALRLLLSTLFVGAPIFFASCCFATAFRDRDESDHALGWNLLGAVTGGLLEMLSMVLGFKALTLLALLAYLPAVLPGLRRR
ncbi:MAG: hypothetical protein AB2A00_07175 [Myxococcota bacterium]